jgi:hypothetical protein
VDTRARKIVFRRVEQAAAEATMPPAKKAGHHPIFGALKGSVRIPEGVDLTEPADPDWGKVYE